MSEHDDVIAYTVGPDDDAVVVCADCAQPDGKNYGEIRDNDAYGDQAPYPECWVCGEVARPETLATDGGTARPEHGVKK